MRWVSSNLQQLFPFLPILNIHPCLFDHSLLSWLEPWREKENSGGERGHWKCSHVLKKFKFLFVLLVCCTCIARPGLGSGACTYCPLHPPPSLTLSPSPWTIFVKHLGLQNLIIWISSFTQMWQKIVLTCICLGWLQCQDTLIQASGSSSPFWCFCFRGRRN